MTKQIDAVYFKLYKGQTGQENQTSQVQEAATYLCLREDGEKRKSIARAGVYGCGRRHNSQTNTERKRLAEPKNDGAFYY